MKKHLLHALLAVTCLFSGKLLAQDSLPDLHLPFTGVNAYVTPAFSGSYYLATVSDVPSGYDVTNGNYASWCVMPNVAIDYNTTYGATLRSSYVTSSTSLNSLPIPDDLQSSGWNAVNYVINHKQDYFAQGAKVSDVQYAIWFLLKGSYSRYTAKAGVVATNALQNGYAFVPTVGQKVAVILDFDQLTGLPLAQDVIIEVTVPTTPVLPGTISGNVYVDNNNNGLMDSGDSSLGGVLMTLTGSNYLGQVVSLTTNTQPDGSYVFSNLLPGTYSVKEGATPGYLENPNTVGTLGGVVSGDVIGGIVLSSGANGTGYNFGELPPAMVSGYNYVDLNNDGVFQATETPIPGTTIDLLGTNDLAQVITLTTLTDDNGFYNFGGLRPGLYQVTETQNPAFNYLQGKNTVGLTNDVSNGVVGPADDQLSQIALAPGANGTNYNFGELPPGSISGFNYIDANNNGQFETGESPIGGTTITLAGKDYEGTPVTQTTVTLSDGSYIFTNLPPSDVNGYSVTENQNTTPPYNLLVQGSNTVGSAGGVVGPNADQLSAIVLLPGAAGAAYNFGELPPPTIVAPPQAVVTCSGSGATFTVTATGHGTLIYQWRKDQQNLTDSASVSGANTAALQINPASTTDSGSYDVIVKDAYGMVISPAATLTVNPTPVVTLTKTDVNCNGGDDGTVTVTISGGGEPYTVSFDGGASMPVTSQQSFTGFTAGMHTVTVAAAEGCFATSTIEIIEPAEPVSLDLATKTDISCKGGNNGSFSVIASGGAGGYAYSIDGLNFSPNNVFANLPAGAYTVVVRDANGCTAAVAVTLGEPPSALAIDTVTKKDISCKGEASGVVAIRASGGVGALSYSIDTGATFSANNVFSNLLAGTYTVVVKDANGCLASTAIVITEPATALALSLYKCDATCVGNDGSITATFSGGSGGYSISLNGGAFVPAISPKKFGGLTNGTYVVMVQDTNKCTLVQSTNVKVVCALTVTCPPDVMLDCKPKGHPCSYTQGGWGAPASGNNPGSLLCRYFTSVYRTGCLQVGVGRCMKFTSASAVSACLPAGGTPTSLYYSTINPTGSPAGVFGGQVLALHLNVDFADAGVTGDTDNGFGDMVLRDSTSPLNNKTVRQILAIAENALGGNDISSTGMNIYSLNNLVTALNEACDGGTTSSWSLSHLGCSNGSAGDTDPSLTGFATASGGFGKITITYSDSSSVDASGRITIVRTWTATDAAGAKSTCTQNIIRPVCDLTVGCVNVNVGQVGVYYSSGIPVSGGKPTYHFCIVSGALPSGLSLNVTNGLISGTPTKAGSYCFSIKVTDSSITTPLSKTVSCSITINSAPLSIGCVDDGTGIVSECYNSALTVAGGKPGYSFAIVSGCLPPGLSLSSCNGTISGTPCKVGIYGFTIKVTDSTCGTPQTATVTCSIAITAVPTGLNACAGNGKVTLGWCSLSGATSYQIGRSTNCNGPFIVIKSGLTTTCYTDTTVTNGVTYYYVVCAVTAGGTGPGSDPVKATPSSLPSPWKTQDVGTVASVGSACYANCAFTLTGSGADIWGTADEFRYLYQSGCGDCSIVARVTDLGKTDSWSKAGVMIRETTGAGSVHASVFVTPGNGVAFQWRSGTAGSSCNVNLSGISTPCWVKLTRVGNSFTAYYSTNGCTWKQVGSTQTIAMATSVNIGLAVTSHNDGVNCTAIFDNVTPKP